MAGIENANVYYRNVKDVAVAQLVSGPPPPVAHAGHRRRGKELESAIFSATLAELAEAGYSGLTMEGIAARAQTGKAALYRRWASKDDLVVEALNANMDFLDEVPDTGNIRDDLLELLRSLVEFITSDAGRAIHSLMNDMAHCRGPLATDVDLNPALAIKHRVIGPRQELALEVLRRGAERGEVRPDAVTQHTVEVGPALVMSRYLAEGKLLDDAELAAIVDEILLPLVSAR